MIGKTYIESTGFDPERGKEINDPYLGPCPTLGICRPDIRAQLQVGDHIFVVTGKVPDVPQFVMCGFEIAEKIHATEAYERFPALRLRKGEKGRVTGNIIVDSSGKRNPLDNHDPKSFAHRAENYVVGKNLIVLTTAAEIAEGRNQTLDVLRDILQRKGNTPFSLIHRSGVRLNDKQVLQMRDWLSSLKRPAVRTPGKSTVDWKSPPRLGHGETEVEQSPIKRTSRGQHRQPSTVHGHALGR